MTTKRVNLQLVGLDSNAFVILGAFRKAATKEGWTIDEIEEVTEEAKKSDFDHLLATIINHCNIDGDNEGDY